MKNFKKKFLSISLVMAMLVTMLPTNVFATMLRNNKMNTTVVEENITENNVNQSDEQNNENEENDKTESGNQNSTKPEENNGSNENKEPEKPETNEQEKINWPQKPGWIGQSIHSNGFLQLQSGQNQSSFYAIPHDKVTQEDIDKAKEESHKTPEAKGNEIQNPETALNMKLVVFIDGKQYTGGDITIKEGQNFSYRLDWGPISDNVEIKEGDYFTKKLFTVKGLNFPDEISRKLIIDGINVGQMEVKYNKNTGEMTYGITFTKYINFFEKNSVFAYFKGSSHFSLIESGNQEIDIWGNKGTLTVEKVEKPTTPNYPTGEGYKAPIPPKFDDKIHSFIKGVKWDSKENSKVEPQIEWRVVFLEKLQEKQREFLKDHPVETKEGILGKIDVIIENVKLMATNTISTITSSLDSSPKEARTVTKQGYCIIEDTLDLNQTFHRDPPNEGDKGKYKGAPFYIELPVMVAGTGTILNGEINRVDTGYGEGPGDISPIFDNTAFTDFTKNTNKKNTDNSTDEDIREKVLNTPLSYAVVKEKDGRETLIINCGKLGSKDEKAIKFPNGSEWPVRKIEDKIKDCQSKIEQITAGQNSAISNLKTKYTELDNLLLKIDKSPTTTERSVNLFIIESRPP